MAGDRLALEPGRAEPVHAEQVEQGNADWTAADHRHVVLELGQITPSAHSSVRSASLSPKRPP